VRARRVRGARGRRGPGIAPLAALILSATSLLAGEAPAKPAAGVGAAGESEAPGDSAPLTTTAAPTAPVRVALRAEPTRVTVGDPVEVSVEISYPDGCEVGAPAPGREWGPLGVTAVRRGEPRRAADGRWTRTDRLQVAAFKPGPLEAPPLTLPFRSADGSVGEVSTPALRLTVESVLAPDEKPEISDLKGPASLPAPRWPWIAGAAAAVVAGAALAWYLALRRRRRLAALLGAPAGPPLPAREWALRELDRLAAAGLLASGRWLDYHVILTEVVKEYLTRRFDIPTLERTTSEVLAAARGGRLGGGPVADLRSVLEPCDLVKFARYRPPRAEAEALLARARAFVEATRPAPEPAAVPAATAAAGS